MGVRPGRLAGATHCSGRPVWLASAPPPSSLPQPCPVPLPRFCCDYPGLGCLHMRQRFPPSPQRLLCCSVSRGVRPFSGLSGNCSEAVSLIPVQPWVTLLWPSPLGRWLCGAPTWTVRWSTALTAPAQPRAPAAETPIEEFTPTPAFPALQYLESVDVEGVAWRAGLRTGDFLIEVRLPLPGRQVCGPRGLEDAPALPAHSLSVPGERGERGEGRTQAGGGSDPPGWEPPRHEGCVGNKEA